MTDPSTPVPSAEAVEAVARAMSDADDGALLASGVGPIPWDVLCESDRESYRDYARCALAYIDAPRIAAEAAAEARAATLREVEAWLREAGTGWPEHELELVADDLAAHFNPEATSILLSERTEAFLHRPRETFPEANDDT